MQTALLYRRVSTDTQDNSLDAQENLCLEYCQRMGLVVGSIFCDRDTSGSVPFAERTDPDGGADLLAAIAQRAAAGHPVHAVVVLKQDRLGRDTIDQIHTVRWFWEHGITPHIVNEGGPLLRTPHNEFLFTVKADTAQLERDTIRERIRIGLAQKKRKGELCGTVPYGFDGVPTGAVTGKGVAIRSLVDNPAEQRWLLHIAARRAAGWGYHSIAKELNSLGVPTKTPKGTLITRPGSKRDGGPGETILSSGLWSCGNVHHVLNNKVTAAWLDRHTL